MADRNITMKCLIKLPEGVYRGSKITIQGRSPPDAQRFSINLLCGPGNDQEDIALHLNPRFPTKEVVRNHYTENKWWQQEGWGGMPLSRDATFEVAIECDESAFKISFNGKDFCEFAHRLPYTLITHMKVDGDVNILSISL